MKFLSNRNAVFLVQGLLSKVFDLAEAYGVDILKSDSEYGRFRVTSDMFDVINNEGIEPNQENINKITKEIKTFNE